MKRSTAKRIGVALKIYFLPGWLLITMLLMIIERAFGEHQKLTIHSFVSETRKISIAYFMEFIAWIFVLCYLFAGPKK